MIQYSTQLLDKIAPRLSELRPFPVPPAIDDDDSLELALLQLGLYEVGAADSHHVFAILRQMVRRIAASSLAYRGAVEHLSRVFENYRLDGPNVSMYFRCIDALESCLINTQITIEAMNKSGLGNGPWVSGPEVDACVGLSNSIKHFGERRGSNRVATGMPIWLEGDRVVDGVHAMGVSRLGEHVAMLKAEVWRVVTRDRRKP